MKYTYQIELEVTPATVFIPLADADVALVKANFEERLSEFVGVQGTAFTKITLTEAKPTV